ncbi:dynein axonemal light chain 4 isoform X1 [Canis lupus baileyi]|uniref:dynein light chain 4, axonemal isoform X1 n=1 Tax=Canis lupus familiaris TaxID=9615 RepID=UPI000BAA0D49|nr:dynein light chain 4, axonemal isoform X1 [Canis lupus familiaris]|eukprot:XP_022280118.1 dynein light chain 4, axonemal isoform X1 [Canis lupus familiaris]
MGETEGKKEEADYKRLQTFPLVRHSDMPEEMRVETMELCVTACEKFSNNNESAAKMIKETMDKKFGSSWHVVIGEGFGFEITHEDGERDATKDEPEPARKRKDRLRTQRRDGGCEGPLEAEGFPGTGVGCPRPKAEGI